MMSLFVICASTYSSFRILKLTKYVIFQNCLILISTLENVFFLMTSFFVESCYEIGYVYKYLSDLGTTHKFSDEFVQ